MALKQIVQVLKTNGSYGELTLDANGALVTSATLTATDVTVSNLTQLPAATGTTVFGWEVIN